MYDMLQAKVDHWSGKIYFVKKKSKNHGQLFGYADFEGAGGLTDDTRSTFRVPLKTLGYTGSN